MTWFVYFIKVCTASPFPSKMNFTLFKYNAKIQIKVKSFSTYILFPKSQPREKKHL